MKPREIETIARTRAVLWNRSGGRCEVCGDQLEWGTFQMAHRIPQRKWLFKLYGARVLHHPMNLAAVCGLDCNNSVSIGGQPMAIQELVDEIEEELHGRR
jgi:hypothetical protein